MEREPVATYPRGAWGVDELVDAKRGRTVSVVLPALDEEESVAGVVASILPLALGSDPLVDELLVVDSGSRDATRARAEAAGAETVAVSEILRGAGPELQPRPGKGEALWRSLAATSGDIVAFVDSDLRDPSPEYVPGIVGPLLLSDTPVLVKGSYRRPFRGAEGDSNAGPGADPDGGGRVTELLARPLLEAFVPEIAALRQPLAGEYAVRREFAESVPFAAEYGVEIGLVLDALRLHGPAGIAQVDLGTREHRHRSLHSLAGTSRHVIEVFSLRLGLPIAERVLAEDRPPMASLPRELRAAHAAFAGGRAGSVGAAKSDMAQADAARVDVAGCRRG